ncbi:MAG: hypothetical protein ACFFCS_24080 [Candidatus Hodarchaeota archaeon]
MKTRKLTTTIMGVLTILIFAIGITKTRGIEDPTPSTSYSWRVITTSGNVDWYDNTFTYLGNQLIYVNGTLNYTLIDE